MAKKDNYVEEIMEQADLEAMGETEAEDAGLKALEEFKENFPYVVKLRKTYEFAGEEIDSIDLSGLEDMTTLDAQYLDRVMMKLNHYPQKKYSDTLYVKHLVARVTGHPIDFIDMLGFKDMNNIISTVSLYFLL